MNKMNKRISARCTEAEYELFLQKCKKANLSKAEFTRKMIFSSVVREQDKDHKKKVLYLLSNISNNVNQIAHRCNISKKIDIQTLDSLKEISEFTKSVIAKEI
jgi:hypothetical protein